MKCEQFLPWLESESYVRAALARQHARRCASCRAAARMLDEVKWSLTESDLLPERLKLAIVTIGETKKIRLTDPSRGQPFSRRSVVGRFSGGLAHRDRALVVQSEAACRYCRASARS